MSDPFGDAGLQVEEGWSRRSSTSGYRCDTRTVLNRIPISELNELVNEPLSDDIVCLDIEDASKGHPSDDQVMMLIKEKTGATNSSAFQQLPADIKKSVLSHVMKQEPVPVVLIIKGC